MNFVPGSIHPLILVAFCGILEFMVSVHLWFLIIYICTRAILKNMRRFVVISFKILCVSLQLYSDNFLHQENVCLATRMPICKESLEQMQGACRKLLKENISFAVRNIANGELAAVAINHLIVCI